MSSDVALRIHRFRQLLRRAFVRFQGARPREKGLAIGLVLISTIAPIGYLLQRPTSPYPASQAGEEFVGPFASWLDVTKAPYTAAGDGKADDTQALQLALDDVGNGITGTPSAADQSTLTDSTATWMPNALANHLIAVRSAGTGRVIDNSVIVSNSQRTLTVKSPWSVVPDPTSRFTISVPNPSSVVYLPAGTYRITRTLYMGSKQNVSIIGEDPTKTTIQWDGSVGQPMAWFDGISQSRIARLTLDGTSHSGGRALSGIEQCWLGPPSKTFPTGHAYADTGNSYEDMYFQNVDYGLRLGCHGQMGSETSILRNIFRNTRTGITTENYNALDEWVWDSAFIHDDVGISNAATPPGPDGKPTGGAGNFLVYDSLFEGSATADVKIGNLGFFTLRGNYSVGSKAFLATDSYSAGAATVIQDNTILDTGTTPIQVLNTGPVLLLDNVIKSPSTPQLDIRDGWAPSLYETYGLPQNQWSALDAIGNTYVQQDGTKLDPYANSATRQRNINDTLVNLSAFTDPPIPALPEPLPNYHRRILDVPPGANADQIQALIDQTQAFSGQRPVVHFPSGAYTLQHALVLPPNADVQLIGDGANSTITYASHTPSEVIDIQGPSHAKLAELSLTANTTGRVNNQVVFFPSDVIHLGNVDQAGGRIFADQLHLVGRPGTPDNNGLLVKGLDQTVVELHGGGPSEMGKYGIDVFGGSLAQAGQSVPGHVEVFASASSDNALNYSVDQEGKLLLQGYYHEGTVPVFASLTGSGTLVADDGKIAPNDASGAFASGSAATNVFTIRNFKGKVAILNQYIWFGNLKVEGDGSQTSVLAMGNEGGDSYNPVIPPIPIGPPDNPYLYDSSNPPARTAFLENEHIAKFGSVPAPDQVSGDVVDQNAFVLDMLSELRNWKPRSGLGSIPGGVTDVRMFRVFTEDASDGNTVVISNAGY